MNTTHIFVVSSLLKYVEGHPVHFPHVADAIEWFKERAKQTDPDDYDYICESIECYTLEDFLDQVNRGWLDNLSELYIYNLNINVNEQIQEIPFPLR